LYFNKLGKFLIIKIIKVSIPVTRRVKEYTSFVEKYAKGRRKRFLLHKVYIHIIDQDH